MKINCQEIINLRQLLRFLCHRHGLVEDISRRHGNPQRLERLQKARGTFLRCFAHHVKCLFESDNI